MSGDPFIIEGRPRLGARYLIGVAFFCGPESIGVDRQCVQVTLEQPFVWQGTAEEARELADAIRMAADGKQPDP